MKCLSASRPDAYERDSKSKMIHKTHASETHASETHASETHASETHARRAPMDARVPTLPPQYERPANPSDCDLRQYFARVQRLLGAAETARTEGMRNALTLQAFRESAQMLPTIVRRRPGDEHLRTYAKRVYLKCVEYELEYERMSAEDAAEVMPAVEECVHLRAQLACALADTQPYVLRLRRGACAESV
jgi:hypothetical protein